MTIPTLHILHVPGADEQRDDIVAMYLDMPYPDVHVCVHTDPKRRGIMKNWLDAVQCAWQNDRDSNDVTGAKTWSIIMQDDAMPMPGWHAAVEEALWYSPAPVLGMSYFGAATEAAFRKNVPYMVGPHLIWGAAVAYRHDFLEGLVPWAKWVYETTEYQHDDRLVSAYANKIGVDTALTVRAIFDQPVEKSTVGHGGGNRRPNITLRSNSGAAYGARPRVHRVRSGAAKEQRDWLVSLGTKNEHPTHTFKRLRSGAVQWLPKESAE